MTWLRSAAARTSRASGGSSSGCREVSGSLSDHERRRVRGQQGSDEQQVAQRAVRELGTGERAQHAGLVERHVEPSAVDGDVEDGAVEGVGDRAVELGPAVLADRLQGRREVASVVGEHRGAVPTCGIRAGAAASARKPS